MTRVKMCQYQISADDNFRNGQELKYLEKKYATKYQGFQKSATFDKADDHGCESH